VPVRRVDVSSTDVRARTRAGDDVGDSVPDPVRAIIERERLYSGS
jgi:nicotinic acid mononucleotide adenylyltransferase